MYRREEYIAHFSQEDLEFLRVLRDKGGLQEIKPERFKVLAEQGLVGTFCPDGYYSMDIYKHAGTFTHQLHLPCLNGGAMLIAPTNPRYERDGQAVIESIRVGWNLGKGKAIVLFSHYPCGMAHLLQYTPQQIIIDTMRADEHITAVLKLREEVVLPLLHVDWTPDKKDDKKCRTYVIKKKCLTLL